MLFVLTCFISFAQVNAQDNWPLDAQSTTGPVPPVEAYTQAAPAAFETQKLISGVPAYIWYRGCGPTAAGMVVGYWDSHGFDNLVSGSAATQTTYVNNMISSSGNYNDYCLPIDNNPPPIPDKSEAPAGDEHPNNCVADFMYTSQSARGNCYGWSWFSHVAPSVSGYASFADTAYQVATTDYYWSGLTWSKFCSEIDAGRPLVFLVDSNSDGSTDHFVTVIGYGVSGGVNMYACYNTWDSPVHWYKFAAMAAGQSFGIYGATMFNVISTKGQIAAAKKLATNASVSLRGAAVSATFGTYFYVQDDERSCGLRVLKNPNTAAVGMRVNVDGTMQMAADGEKYISATTVTQNGTGSVKSLGLSNKTVGGSPWFYNDTTKTGQNGIADAQGLNNIGLLIRTTGRVIFSTTGYFYLDDGCKLSDTSATLG
jgi:hypothetical protein